MALFGEGEEPFLRSFLTLAMVNPAMGLQPSISHSQPDQFRDSFHRSMAQLSEQMQGMVAIDGKALRRSFERANGK